MVGEVGWGKSRTEVGKSGMEQGQGKVDQVWGGNRFGRSSRNQILAPFLDLILWWESMWICTS